jgi:hypothetical protein
VISEQAAKKYFGNNDAVGKIVKLGEDEGKLFTVSAVAKNFPLNSSMQFDVLFPIEKRWLPGENRSGSKSCFSLNITPVSTRHRSCFVQKKTASFGEQYFKSSIDRSKKFNPEVREPKIDLAIRSFLKDISMQAAPGFTLPI